MVYPLLMNYLKLKFVTASIQEPLDDIGSSKGTIHKFDFLVFGGA